jgi:NAD+ diphosphatase
MKIAETVTFGGSGLERFAELRGDPVALASAKTDPRSSAIVFWRGKPLLEDTAQGRLLARLPLNHPLLAETAPDHFFLGKEDGAAVFAQDLAGWTPPDQDAAILNSFLDRSEQHHPAMPETFRFAELRAVMTRLSPRDAELAASARALLNWHATHGFCAVCGARSEVAKAGWQRDCPSCGAHHFPRTDAVVIMLITHGNSVLMGRSPGWPEGMYSLLAGFIEPGETIESAVRREVWEEAGVHVGQVDYLASQPWPFPSSLMLGCRGEATSREITIDPLEIEDAMWVTRDDMLEAFAGRHPKLLPARKGAIAHFILSNWLADKLE